MPRNSYGVSPNTKVFVLMNGRTAKAKRLRKITRVDAESLVKDKQATWCRRQDAREILAKAAEKEEEGKEKKKKKKQKQKKQKK